MDNLSTLSANKLTGFKDREFNSCKKLPCKSPLKCKTFILFEKLSGKLYHLAKKMIAVKVFYSPNAKLCADMP